MHVLTWLVIALCVALGGWAAWRALRDQPVILRQLFAAGAIEAVLLVQLVVVGVLQARGATVEDPVTLWGYLISMLLVLPAAGVVAFVERTRWSSLVLLLAALTTGFLQFRVLVLWLA